MSSYNKSPSKTFCIKIWYPTKNHQSQPIKKTDLVASSQSKSSESVEIDEKSWKHAFAKIDEVKEFTSI